MKKSFFQQTYNPNINLLVFGIVSYILEFSLQLWRKLIGNINIASLETLIILVQNKLLLAEHYLHILASMLIVIAVVLIIIELFIRITTDSIWNYFKSIYQTFRLRQFLRQDEKSESIISIDNQTTVTKFNPILKNFNHTVSKCTVDIRKESVKVFIKYPKTQQAQKLLKDMESHIKEEISSRNPDFYFSAPNREGNKLWYIGTKR